VRFLADQDVYWITVEWLRKEGHDVVTAKELGKAIARVVGKPGTLRFRLARETSASVVGQRI